MRRRLAAVALAVAALAATACTAEQRAALEEAAQNDPTPSWTVDWDKVANCESGGNWGHGPVTNSSGTYSGGLMWNVRYWISNGGGRYASAPHLATKAQQIQISEEVIGGSYAKADQMWQCIGGPARSGV